MASNWQVQAPSQSPPPVTPKGAEQTNSRITINEISGAAATELPLSHRIRTFPFLRNWAPQSRSDHLQVRRKTGRNWITRCPSCAAAGRDKSGDNLAISVDEPQKYICWAGCSKEMIRAALGCPIPEKRESAYAVG